MIRNIAIHANLKYVSVCCYYMIIIFLYQVGALVLKKDFRRKKRKGGKLDDRWLGPYMISKDLGKGFYSLSDEKEVTVNVVERINGAHLKKYEKHSCEEDISSCDENKFSHHDEDECSYDDEVCFGHCSLSQ